jgi:hypothetical protein
MAKQSKAKQSKAKFIVLGILALTALGGTYAWSSISQRVNNISDIPPTNAGARLHDDFNIEAGNKNIYVENYGDEPVLVRVKLYEYLEKDGESLIPGADPNDVSTWSPYTMTSLTALGTDTQKFRPYVTWEFANTTTPQKVYVPTFNTDNTNRSADASGDGLDVLTGAVTHPGAGKWDDFQMFEQVPSLDGTATHETTNTPRINRDLQMMGPITTTGNSPNRVSSPFSSGWIADKDGWFYAGSWIAPGVSSTVLLKSLQYKFARIYATSDHIKYRIWPVMEYVGRENIDDFYNGSSPYGDASTDAQSWFTYMHDYMISSISQDAFTVKPGESLNLTSTMIPTATQVYPVNFQMFTVEPTSLSSPANSNVLGLAYQVNILASLTGNTSSDTVVTRLLGSNNQTAGWTLTVGSDEKADQIKVLPWLGSSAGGQSLIINIDHSGS